LIQPVTPLASILAVRSDILDAGEAFKMTRYLLLILALLLVSSCNRNKETPSQETSSAAAQQATVVMRDGTRYSGTVTNSSTTQVTLAGDGANSRTFDMKDVKSIEYGTPANPVAPAAPSAGPAARAVRPESERRSAPAAAPERAPARAPRKVPAIELPVGTEVSVRTNETIDSKKATEGQSFSAEVAKDILDSSGSVVIPRGSNAEVVIRSSSKGGRITGASDMVLDLRSITIDGRQYAIDTADIEKSGRDGLGKNKRTAEYVGGGAIVGTIIGAIAGHGKGAAIGAASGAAAGAATQVITRGSAIKVPAETILTFRLDKPLIVYPTQH
jgi:hypothetical protein